ncbi:hypothetical protein [Sphingobacterium corticibacterium]|uniref:Phosphoenolpyruvate carboxykinase n=1 Tax=Sphingobacterium corticibacterium TaxID=2484746 RepID=A0A4Q6XRL6_9SPHI|nr:hypothetical protein [Sphingobacterium corticibacterium]RZF58876.1 hypothetical protein EWE74_16265 [Sphingobacterium corticibacterium]
MKINPRTTLTSLFYEIAGLQLELRLSPTVNVDMLLPSFTGFRINVANDRIPAATVTLLESEPPEENEMGVLRSDISVVWGDNFRFYERENTFVTQIKHPVKEMQWVMESTRDFKESVIYGNAKDPRMGELVSWLLMVVFGQAGLQYQLILIHASVIAHRAEHGVAFLGKSGTGKSTHSKLWLQHIPETALLNDDNPAVRIEDNDQVFIYGTPWSGKTPCYKNSKVELKAFVRLEQAPYNRFTKQENMHSLIAVLPSCTAIRWNKTLFQTMTNTLSRIVGKVMVGQLECLPDAQAAYMSSKAVFGSKAAGHTGEN